MSSGDDAAIALAKATLRAHGWYVRYTEWPSGHQVVIHRREDTAIHRVTSWHGSEVAAWNEALSLELGFPDDVRARPSAFSHTPPPERPGG